MKLALVSGILAASLTTSNAQADAPLMDAFSDLLGSCWAYSGERRSDEIYSADEQAPNNEIYCFERMENHFVRIRRQAPGPHGGAFYNVEILHWNAATQRIITVMFTSALSWGHINYNDGTIEDGLVTINAYENEFDGPYARYSWGAVEGDQVTMVTEQAMGDEAGGWGAPRTRTYTRQAASVGPALAARMTGSPSFSPATDLFQPLLGACWSTGPDHDGPVDTHCFTDLLGRYVRDRHIIPGNPAYGGETFFFYDTENESVEFFYYNSIGGISDGSNVHAADGIVYDREYYRGPDGETRTFRGRFEAISFDGYTSVTEEMQGDDWVEVSRQAFVRSADNPFVAN
tara:strand:- start:8434 stop:9468 length:1035 start_codon:yes stop_codon:yes gene_type:complete